MEPYMAFLSLCTIHIIVIGVFFLSQGKHKLRKRTNIMLELYVS